MASTANSGETAIDLMRRALTLLDQSGDTVAAARLQHAIDTAGDEPVASSDDLVVKDFASSAAPHEQALMRSLLAKLSRVGAAAAIWVIQECGCWLGGAVGAAAVRQRLRELGLEAERLPPEARAKLRQDIAALCESPRRPRSWQRLAIGFFTWYVTEASDFTPDALKGERAVADALTTIQNWCEADPQLVKAVARDFHLLRVHLFHTGSATSLRSVDP